MNASYRIGLLIVAGTVLLSTALVTATAGGGRPGAQPRVGQELSRNSYDLGSFRLVERSGRRVTEADLADDVWVAGFIFTRCPTSCPKISSVMKSLQPTFARAGVKLVSLSVDPDFDTPAVLSRYAEGLGADPVGWWFLTGKQDEIVDLILTRFYLPIARDDPGDASPDEKRELVQHSSRLVLVDRGNKVVGFFDSDDPDAVKALVSKATRRASWARHLPLVNASLNGSCALLLVVGWVLIRARWRRAHAACMIAAVTVSAVFLACYLVYHSMVGSVSFEGQGLSRTTYLSILLSHTILATLGVVPLVSLTLYRAIRRQFDRHAKIARVTFPIWLYVSITGVIIYVMLYQMPLVSSTN